MNEKTHFCYIHSLLHALYNICCKYNFTGREINDKTICWYKKIEVWCYKLTIYFCLIQNFTVMHDYFFSLFQFLQCTLCLWWNLADWGSEDVHSRSFHSWNSILFHESVHYSISKGHAWFSVGIKYLWTITFKLNYHVRESVSNRQPGEDRLLIS